ncbi:hypothetical protein [Clostridium saccharoperbutylacetonicum]|uniref:hypothetical protein n=1 Tax=Clostridium saccharoperbutylacetonicum TaxID=36745 RepID=UPI000983DDBF|nr:hypothetical protein [Clostridium saccharoperbutylacetonicum]AQR94531.1 hypothetical protein CLSAP_18420 [Clostridium saccharoperbutylacetonicum]NSB30366.1 hypothetical protein [Clostridium saccharoperbutylacetonicum]
MKKLYKLEQLEVIRTEYTKEVLASIEEVIITLNENYGVDREVDKDLGGYVAILESKVILNHLKALGSKVEIALFEIINKRWLCQ